MFSSGYGEVICRGVRIGSFNYVSKGKYSCTSDRSGSQGPIELGDRLLYVAVGKTCGD